MVLASHGHPCCAPAATPPIPRRSGLFARPRVPRAVVLPRPPQHLQVPARSGPSTRFVPQGQSCSCAHCKIARCPPRAAACALPLIPWAVELPRPLQHLQVPSLGARSRHSPRVARRRREITASGCGRGEAVAQEHVNPNRYRTLISLLLFVTLKVSIPRITINIRSTH